MPRATRHSQSRVKLLQVVILHLPCTSTGQWFSPTAWTANLPPDMWATLGDNTQGHSRCAVLICNCRCKLWKKHHQMPLSALSALGDRNVHQGQQILEKQEMNWELLARVRSQLVFTALSGTSPSTGSRPVTANSVNWGKCDCTDHKWILRHCPGPLSAQRAREVSQHTVC